MDVLNFQTTVPVPVTLLAAMMVSALCTTVALLLWCQTSTLTMTKTTTSHHEDEDKYAVLPCIRNRASRFPRTYNRHATTTVDRAVVQLLDAALWGPFHGRCFAGCQHPAKLVVLGRQAMVDMQYLTLDYYDRNWRTVGWGSGSHGSEQGYAKWRQQTEDEITGRWAPCSYMIAICMRRQTAPHTKRLPEWEEAAAVAAMHLQSTKFPELACYWSSWHDAARDSDEMKAFLKMDQEDKVRTDEIGRVQESLTVVVFVSSHSLFVAIYLYQCMGFFVIAQVKPESRRDRRTRDRSLLAVEFRD